MNFIVTHIYREGHACDDRLASPRLSIQVFCGGILFRISLGKDFLEIE